MQSRRPCPLTRYSASPIDKVSIYQHDAEGTQNANLTPMRHGILYSTVLAHRPVLAHRVENVSEERGATTHEINARTLCDDTRRIEGEADEHHRPH